MKNFSSSSFHRRAISFGVALSLILHALLISPLLLDSHVQKPKPDSIDIVFHDAGTPPTADSSAGGSVSKASSKDIFTGGFQTQSLARLRVSSAEVNRPDVGEEDHDFRGDPLSKVATGSAGWSVGVQYGNAMGLSKTLETLPFFEALYDRVNQQLLYPDDFSKQRVTGKIRIEAEVSFDGRLVRFVSTQADDGVLQAYCFAALLQILDRPLPKATHLPHDRAIVSFDFEFQVRLPTETPRHFARTVQKNRLAFGRENEVDPWLNEKIEEVFTHYVPPIIPLPGGVYVDFVMAYKYVRNLIEGAPLESELRQARIEKLHETLRQTLKRATPFETPHPSPTPET